MKGIVFTEFLEMVEDRYGLATVDQIIQEANLPTGGAYTAVGTYDPREMFQLVGRLSGHTATSVPDLLRVFGEHLFLRLATTFPSLIDGCECSFDVLNRIEDVVHVEVQKLYPDAELPHFDAHQPAEDRLVLIYRSPRGLADLAEGLIRGCAAWYHEQVDIEREDLSGGNNTHVRFTLQRQ